MADIIYKAKYKCRLCGNIFENCIETDKEGAIILSIGSMNEELRGVIDTRLPRAFDIHKCGNGDMGCAEFIGWQLKRINNG